MPVLHCSSTLKDGGSAPTPWAGRAGWVDRLGGQDGDRSGAFKCVAEYGVG